MKKTIKLIALRAFVAIMSVTLTFLPAYSVYATIDESTLNFYAQNNILFYDPTAAQNLCSSGGDCYIAGDMNKKEDIYWSGLRHAGFTPEQTAGIMGSLFREAGSVTRQEQVYIDARNSHCKTQEGREYSIWEDSESHGVHHSSCIGNYKAGNDVVGIGLGIVQWSSHSRRMGFLNTLSEMGLLKYFDGQGPDGQEAWNTWGTWSNEDIRNEIIAETGSDNDYWALWCAQFKYIWTEMHGGRFAKFFDQPNDWESYASFVSEVYEDCELCDQGESSWNDRIATAKTIWDKYENGDFDDIENGTAPVLISPSGGSTATSTGTNVLIIGDSIIEKAKSNILSILPDATIEAQNSKQFVGDDTNNPSALQILKQYGDSNELSKFDFIVIALGTDGANFTFDNGEEIAKTVGLRKVFFVNDFDANDKGKYKNNNSEFDAVTNPNAIDNAELINWAAAAESNESTYVENGTTPTNSGADALAKLIANAIGSIKPTNTCTGGGGIVDGEGLILYSQGQAPWGSIAYGQCWDSDKQRYSPYSEAGCGPSALAMIIANFTGDTSVTPNVIGEKAVRGGYRACGNGSYGSMAKIATEYGLKVTDYGEITSNTEPLSADEMSQHLRQGEVFFASGVNVANLFSENGHYIGIYTVTPEGKWKIFDSGRSENNGKKEFDPSYVRNGLHNHLWGISR